MDTYTRKRLLEKDREYFLIMAIQYEYPIKIIFYFLSGEWNVFTAGKHIELGRQRSTTQHKTVGAP
jgi:hypothetical protein